MAREIVRHEVLLPGHAAAYRSTFAPSSSTPEPGKHLPPGWEGIYFPFDAAFPELRPDGSPGPDGLVPDLGLPRRMYAGEDTSFHRPLRYGDRVEQRTRLGTVTHKTGRSGEMVFVDLERTFSVDGELCISSVWHDVFLPAQGPAVRERAATDPPDAEAGGGREREEWEAMETMTLDSRQLFRFSALTFNTHRVHYDHAWACEVEGLPGLLVQGPLMRILLLDFAARRFRTSTITELSMRSTSPAFVDRPFTLGCRRSAENRTELAALHATGEAIAVAQLGQRDR